MSGTAFVLHIEPAANCTSEVTERIAQKSSILVHRYVSDVASLDAALQERAWNAILCSKNELNDANTPHSFLDSLPGTACQLHLNTEGALNFTYVSAGCMDLLGVTPPQLEQRPELLLGILHPDDAETFYQGMRQSASQGTPWNWEGRIVLPGSGYTRAPHLNPLPLAGEEASESLREIQTDEIKWVNLRAKHPVTDTQGTVWNGFMVNITQNKLTGIDIEQSRQRLRELSSHIEHIKEEERMRIAREIHDEIGVLLTALKMDLSWLKQRLSSQNHGVQEKITDMSNLLDTAGKSANNLVHSLRPGFLDCFGIVAAIEIEAKEFTKRTGIPCKITKSDDNIEVTDEHSITLFRVFQETLNNIMKHATAQQVQVQILQHKKCLELIVSDDGKGFDESDRTKPRSFGLRGIQERIYHLGGKVKIASKRGEGTKISVCLPVKILHMDA